jgi:lambda family phage tail tape measure protein
MNIAELGIRVDSTDAAQAATDLEKMTKAGERAEQSAVGLMDEMKALEKALSAGAKTTHELGRQRDALAKLTKAGAYGEAEFGKITAALDKQQAALVKSTLDEQKALNSLLSAIDPARAALAKLDGHVESLGKHFDAGRLSQSEYAEALGKLEAQYTVVSGGANQLDLSTAGAKESMVELAKAAAAGDFDRAGLAFARLATATGNSVIGLVQLVAPAALAAAAIGTLAYGYYKGSKEADEYNKSLILTGNYAGKSADQLADLARQVSATNGTTGEAAASLSKLAASGLITGDSFKGIADAAAAMEDATGKSVDATIAEFVLIAKDPVAAAKTLNDQYHFLTASVYAQIVALKEQGNEAGAVRLLTDTFIDTLTGRSKEVTDNLGLWQRAWRGVTDAAKKSLDTLNNFGRPDIDADIEQAQRDLDRAKAGDIGLFQNKQVMIDYYDNKLNMLRDEKAAKADIAKYDGEQAKTEQDAIDAAKRIKAVNDSGLTALQKRNKLQAEYLADVVRLRKANANDPNVQPKAVAKGLAVIADRYKDPKAGPGQVDLSGFHNAKNQLAAALGYYSNLEKELNASHKAGLTSQESYHAQRIALIQQQAAEIEIAYQAEISALEAARNKKSTTAEQAIQLDQKIADTRVAMVKAQQDAQSKQQILATEEEGRLKQQTARVNGYTDALKRQADALRLAGERAVSGVGRGDRANALNAELNAQQDRFAQQSLDLANQKSDPSRSMSDEEFAEKTQTLADAHKSATDQIRKNYADIEAAQSSWLSGATSAWDNYLDSARDVTGQTRSMFTSAFSSMEDAIVQFAMTGKLSFADFTRSILADIARIATRQAIVQMLSSIAGSFAGGSAKSPGSTAQGYGPEYFPQAKGGAWDSGVQLFAKGAAISDGVVTRPTAFGMAGGKTGVMGEDGPEAIMPLTRTASGALGVRAVGAGATGGNVFNFPIHVSIDASGAASATVGDPQTGAELGKGIQDAARAEAESAIRKGLQPGGRIWLAIKGRG